MKKSDLIIALRQSIIDKTNKYGYVDITPNSILEVVNDLEKIIPITYEDEVCPVVEDYIKENV